MNDLDNISDYIYNLDNILNISDFVYDYDPVERTTDDRIPFRAIFVTFLVLGLALYGSLLIQQVLILAQNRWKSFAVAFLCLALGSIGEICFSCIPIIFYYFEEPWIGGIFTCRVFVALRPTAQFLKCYSITGLLLASVLTARQHEQKAIILKVIIGVGVAMFASIFFSIPQAINAYVNTFVVQACHIRHTDYLMSVWTAEFSVGRCLPYLINLILGIHSLKQICKKDASNDETELEEVDKTSNDEENIELVDRREYNPVVWILVIALVEFMTAFPYHLNWIVLHHFRLNYVLGISYLLGFLIVPVLSVIATVRHEKTSYDVRRYCISI